MFLFINYIEKDKIKFMFFVKIMYLIVVQMFVHEKCIYEFIFKLKVIMIKFSNNQYKTTKYILNLS